MLDTLQLAELETARDILNRLVDTMRAETTPSGNGFDPDRLAAFNRVLVTDGPRLLCAWAAFMCKGDNFTFEFAQAREEANSLAADWGMEPMTLKGGSPLLAFRRDEGARLNIFRMVRMNKDHAVWEFQASTAPYILRVLRDQGFSVPEGG